MKDKFPAIDTLGIWLERQSTCVHKRELRELIALQDKRVNDN